MTRIAISEEAIETLRGILKEIDPSGITRISPSMLAAMMIARYGDHFINSWKSSPDLSIPSPPLPSFSPTPSHPVTPPVPPVNQVAATNNAKSPPPFEL